MESFATSPGVGFSATVENKSMPSIKVYLHFVWTTKKRIPFLYHTAIRMELWNHIEYYAKSKSIHVLNVNGHSDHCHCLISMSNTQTIAELAQYIKGESSYWINKSGIIKGYFVSEKFDWQNDYHVQSVSPSHLDSVSTYISNQENHHVNQNFDDELKSFINAEF